MAQVPIYVALTLKEELRQLAQGGYGGPEGSSSGFQEELGLDRCVSLGTVRNHRQVGKAS